MTEKMSIAIASDLSGFPLKEAIVDHLNQRGDIELLDFRMTRLNTQNHILNKLQKLRRRFKVNALTKEY